MSTAPGTPPSPFAEGGGDVPASIQRAAEDGQVGAVLSWFDGGARVDETFEYIFLDGPASGMTLLMVAMGNGQAELAEALLRRGADTSLLTSDGSCYALGLAAVNGHKNLVELALRPARRLTRSSATATLR